MYHFLNLGSFDMQIPQFRASKVRSWPTSAAPHTGSSWLVKKSQSNAKQRNVMNPTLLVQNKRNAMQSNAMSWIQHYWSKTNATHRKATQCHESSIMLFLGFFKQFKSMAQFFSSHSQDLHPHPLLLRWRQFGVNSAWLYDEIKQPHQRACPAGRKRYDLAAPHLRQPPALLGWHSPRGPPHSVTTSWSRWMCSAFALGFTSCHIRSPVRFCGSIHLMLFHYNCYYVLSRLRASAYAWRPVRARRSPARL
jgi:hypothetical protein